jgi:hypothetical protein
MTGLRAYMLADFTRPALRGAHYLKRVLTPRSNGAERTHLRYAVLRHRAVRRQEFLFSRHRLNVAISRARCVSILVGAPRIFEPNCRTPEQMRMANAFCAYLERAVIR